MTDKPRLPEDEQCPVCGYYCLGNGGHGCIDKPSMVVLPDLPDDDVNQDPRIRRTAPKPRLPVELVPETIHNDYWTLKIGCVAGPLVARETLSNEGRRKYRAGLLAAYRDVEACSTGLDVDLDKIVKARIASIEAEDG